MAKASTTRKSSRKSQDIGEGGRRKGFASPNEIGDMQIFDEDKDASQPNGEAPPDDDLELTGSDSHSKRGSGVGGRVIGKAHHSRFPGIRSSQPTATTH